MEDDEEEETGRERGSIVWDPLLTMSDRNGAVDQEYSFFARLMGHRHLSPNVFGV